MSGSSTDQKINDALAQVRTLIEQLVRHEQLIDRLTALPNDEALTEALEQSLKAREEFWCAFVEIDHFKRLNDRFGYQKADFMLQKVADHLRLASTYFPGGATAFRAHGDEFYLLGPMPDGASDDEVAQNLDLVRVSVAGMRLPATPGGETMQCTVSVGWARTSRLTGTDLTARGVRLVMEAAVNHAKRQGRDVVVAYSEAFKKTEFSTIRDHCPSCKVAFTVDLPPERTNRPEVFCPSCGKPMPAPKGRHVQPQTDPSVPQRLPTRSPGGQAPWNGESATDPAVASVQGGDEVP